MRGFQRSERKFWLEILPEYLPKDFAQTEICILESQCEKLLDFPMTLKLEIQIWKKLERQIGQNLDWKFY
jgi:hypothetical protein